MSSQEVGLATVLANIVNALNQERWAEAEALIMPALDQFPHLPQLWFHAGNLFFVKEHHAMSMACYERGQELEPVAAGYANLGAVYRRMQMHDKALESLERAVELEPDKAQTWNNLAACYVNEGDPATGLKYANKALEIEPGYNRAEWNKSLMLLELGRYGEGFDLYRSGLGKDRIIKKYTRVDGSEVPYLPADYQGTAGKKPGLIVYGEQGLGDELMFASVLNDARQDFDITYDCHDRLVDIFRRRWDDIDIRPTRKIEPVPWAATEDFCVSIADLCAIYRRTREDFLQAWKEHGPFWSADPEETASYRLMLKALAGDRKIIGLTTRGGVIKTARFYRTMKIEDLAPLLSDKRYLFVNMDYENVDAAIEHVNKTYGPETMYGFRAISHHFNYDHTAALLAATDALVTVNQSLFHLAGGMGHPTLCLTPYRPAWRYGLTGKRHYWYPSKNVRMFRQEAGKDWQKPIQQACRRLEVMLMGGKA